MPPLLRSALLWVAITCACLAHGVAVKTGTVTASELQARQAKFKDPRLRLAMPTTGVDLFKITYPSTDIRNHPANLSGLLMLPRDGAAKGLLVYYHATNIERAQSPSVFTGNNKNPEAEAVMLAFAGGGYAVAMPDYLGLGDDAGVHPYPLAEVNSRAGIDMVQPVREAAAQTGTYLGPRLLVAGYSEGGAVAMWAVRRLEAQRSPGMTPSMAAPMSGPYDLTGATARALLRHRLNAIGVGERLFLLGYAAYSALDNLDGIKLEDYFSPSFATYIPFVFQQHLGMEASAKKLALKGFALGALQSIEKVLTPRFRDSLANEDLKDPLIATMSRNNCFDWAPHTKILLPYLTTDGVVVPANTTEAIDAMRTRGVGINVVRSYPIYDPHLDHVSAAGVALVAARRFFDGGFANVFSLR
jgi:pimeloyl-ACP methyl ester carboxylesterase